MKNIFKMNWGFEIREFERDQKCHDVILVLDIDKIAIEALYVNEKLGFYIADSYTTRKKMHIIKELNEHRDETINKIKHNLPIELKAELCEHMLDNRALEYREMC